MCIWDTILLYRAYECWGIEGGGEGTGIYNWCFREDVMLWSFSVSIYMSVRIFLYGANIKQNTFLYDWCIMEERYLTFLSNNIILCLLCLKIWTHYCNTINALRDYSMLKLCVFQQQVWFRFPVENPISLKHKFMWVYRRWMNLVKLNLLFMLLMTTSCNMDLYRKQI